MKATELIESLKKLIEKHGDLSVKAPDFQAETATDIEAVEVSVDEQSYLITG